MPLQKLKQAFNLLCKFMRLCYNHLHEIADMLVPLYGGDSMTVYEALSLMIAFATLIAVICLSKK